MKAPSWALAWVAALVAAGALGCGRTGKSQGPAAPAAMGGQGGVDEPPIGVDPEACSVPQPGPAPLRRLSVFELQNSVRALLADVPAVAQELDSELSHFGGSYYDEPTLDVTIQAVDAHHRLAHQAALELTTDATALAAFAGCDPLVVGEEVCREQLVERVLLRTYRRPPASDELSDMQDVFQTGLELGGDFSSGARAVLEVALQAPDFLYLIEQGEGDAQDGVVALTPYETAARLAYFLTGSPPDADLYAAADTGALGEAGIEAQARRLLGTPLNRRLSRHFYEQLFNLASVEVTLPENPTYTPEILALTLEETGRFVEDVTFDGAGTFEALLTEPTTWLNGPLAAFYGGSTGVGGDDFQKVQLDPQRRGGIFTQSAFLTATSPGRRTSPVMRGLTVQTKLLCVEMPPPPAIIDLMVPATLPEPATTRQRYEAAITGPACLDCHDNMDALGFAFENYDAVGLWRDTENGLPIDASGTLTETDAQGSFGNAIELLQRIAASDDGRACFASNWLSYAYGRREAPEDACAQKDVLAAFDESGGNIQELLVALAKTDQLRYRLASELAP